jgi:plasmid segregation protein ParM
LGRGAELERILFVGGGTVALATHIRDWFPNQVIAEHPAFANARGMLKYLRYVCEASYAA